MEIKIVKKTKKFYNETACKKEPFNMIEIKMNNKKESDLNFNPQFLLKQKENDQIRANLFNQMLQNEKGILITDLISKLHNISRIWNIFNEMCQRNVTHFAFFHTIQQLRRIRFYHQDYLFLRFGSCQFLIMNLTERKNLKEEEAKKIFNPIFFDAYFNEKKPRIETFKGNVEEFIYFYENYQNIFHLNTRIVYALSMKENTITFSYNFASYSAQLHFRSQNQTLYENIELNGDLSPYGLQDATKKMSSSLMVEIIEKVKLLKIPSASLPDDLKSLYKEILKEEKKEISFYHHKKEEPKRTRQKRKRVCNQK